jgi:hypothetical protein
MRKQQMRSPQDGDFQAMAMLRYDQASSREIIAGGRLGPGDEFRDVGRGQPHLLQFEPGILTQEADLIQRLLRDGCHQHFPSRDFAPLGQRNEIEAQFVERNRRFRRGLKADDHRQFIVARFRKVDALDDDLVARQRDQHVAAGDPPFGKLSLQPGDRQRPAAGHRDRGAGENERPADAHAAAGYVRMQSADLIVVPFEGEEIWHQVVFTKGATFYRVLFSRPSESVGLVLTLPRRHGSETHAAGQIAGFRP